MHRSFRTLVWSGLMLAGLAQADTGKLLLTGGVSSITGVAGGGLTPWAVIGSNATQARTGSWRALMGGQGMGISYDMQQQVTIPSTACSKRSAPRRRGRSSPSGCGRPRARSGTFTTTTPRARSSAN